MTSNKDRVTYLEEVAGNMLANKHYAREDIQHVIDEAGLAVEGCNPHRVFYIGPIVLINSGLKKIIAISSPLNFLSAIWIPLNFTAGSRSLEAARGHVYREESETERGI